MSRIRKKDKKGAPAISTASLPDIVFMLLFFFMVTTVMRETDLQVKVNRPDASEVSKLEKKSLIAYIYVGQPYDKRYGKEPRIQLDDQIVQSESNEYKVEEFIVKFRGSKKEAEQPFIQASLKVDKTAKMGVITRIKEHLRNVDQLRIAYSTNEAAK